jgi:hypothetical protein
VLVDPAAAEEAVAHHVLGEQEKDHDENGDEEELGDSWPRRPFSKRISNFGVKSHSNLFPLPIGEKNRGTIWLPRTRFNKIPGAPMRQGVPRNTFTGCGFAPRRLSTGINTPRDLHFTQMRPTHSLTAARN